MLVKKSLVIFSLFVAIVIPPSANVFADGARLHTIVDSFGELGTAQSEVFALPEAEVQKIIDNVSNSGINNRLPCKSLNVAPCAGDTGIGMRIYLPVCTSVINTLCIESLAISPNSDSPLVTAKYLGGTDGLTFPADPSRGFPEASTPSRWQVPGVMHMGNADTYVVKVLMDAYISSKTKKLFIFDLNAVVEGYSGPDLKTGTKAEISEKQRIALALHLPNTLTGWLNGRLTNPNISITKIDDSQNRISVEANPVLVPEVSVLLTNEQEATLPTPYYFRNPDLVTWWNSTTAGNNAAVEWIRQLSGIMKDTSSGEHRSWFLSTVGNNVASASNPCLQNKNQMIGLVTTNSAAYSPGAPDFFDGFLNYQVAGLHYRPDGQSLTIGTYDLLMRSDVARCLYNFTSAPISATVSISTESGSSQIATTIVKEADGWLQLGAYGFTYSKPIVKVKLTGTVDKSKVKSASPTPSNSPSNINQPGNSSSAGQQNKSPQKVNGYPITCVKGKVVKKIIAAKPMCPSGWKKKS